MEKQEIEVKFFLKDIKVLEARLRSLNAELVSPRVLETNLRFDRPDGELRRTYQILRLRRDYETYLTYKEAAQVGKEVSARREIEFMVSDYDAARSFLMALGYETVMMYEKYRTSYRLDECLVELDEMPYGNFVEIEAADGSKIKPLAKKLSLDWEARSLDSYLVLFDVVCNKKRIHPKYLTFSELKGLNFNAEDFSLQPGDG